MNKNVLSNQLFQIDADLNNKNKTTQKKKNKETNIFKG